MTRKKYAEAIEALGLSQERAGVFFGYSPRQGQRFARGEVDIPPAVAMLIGLMLKHKVKPEDMETMQ